MAKLVALDLLKEFSSNARQARGADDTPAVGGGADGGSAVAGGSGAAVGRQPVGDSDHQAPLSRRGRDVSLSDDDYRPRYDDYCGSSSDGSDSEGFSDQEARTMRSRRVPDETVWHVDDEAMRTRLRFLVYILCLPLTLLVVQLVVKYLDLWMDWVPICLMMFQLVQIFPSILQCQ